MYRDFNLLFYGSLYLLHIRNTVFCCKLYMHDQLIPCVIISQLNFCVYLPIAEALYRIVQHLHKF